MSISLLTTFLLFSAMPGVALADYESGNSLLRVCTAGPSDPTYYQHRARCGAYIAGIADAADRQKTEDHAVCVPGAVTAGQATDVVVAYLKAHPASRHRPAGILVIDALSNAFPCSP
jgi:hypothetical protein